SVAGSQPGSVDVELERDCDGYRRGRQTPQRCGWACGTACAGNVSSGLHCAGVAAGGASCVAVTVSILQSVRDAYGQRVIGKESCDTRLYHGCGLRVGLRVVLAQRCIALRSQRSEVRGQKSEVRSQRSEVRSQKSEVRSQRSEVRGQRSEVRSQKSEVGCDIKEWAVSGTWVTSNSAVIERSAGQPRRGAMFIVTDADVDLLAPLGAE